MLMTFSVGNFRSFKETVTFSMVAANITAKNKDLDRENLFSIGNVSLLKSASIYGANASGKSNVLRAFAFMKDFVLHSTEGTSQSRIDIQPFLLSTETDDKPSFFEAVFLIEGIRYRYGFEVERERVHTEWLYRTKKRETELFWREGSQIEHNRSGFREGQDDLKARTRENALFLSVVDQWNGRMAGEIVSWFKNARMISGLNDFSNFDFTVEQIFEGTIGLEISKFIRQIDLGISDVRAEKNAPNWTYLKQVIKNSTLSQQEQVELLEAPWEPIISYDVKTIHNRYDKSNKVVGQVEFDLNNHESEGTKKAFSLSGAILYALQKGQVLFIDELDARLHPLITRHIIELFNSNYTNPNNAQLIFVTHDTNLLDNQLFRRDQIWFTEKNRYGATDLYSLVEYELPVRYDASFESDYIAGKYGAIPYLGNIKRLVGEMNE
ncbi:MAG TPA: ATP-binding protein [Anaerolineae bacterium]|nr:ATP-binding protein [Anaerolineae bacterium]